MLYKFRIGVLSVVEQLWLIRFCISPNGLDALEATGDCCWKCMRTSPERIKTKVWEVGFWHGEIVFLRALNIAQRLSVFLWHEDIKVDI